MSLRCSAGTVRAEPGVTGKRSCAQSSSPSAVLTQRRSPRLRQLDHFAVLVNLDAGGDGGSRQPEGVAQWMQVSAVAVVERADVALRWRAVSAALRALSGVWWCIRSACSQLALPLLQRPPLPRLDGSEHLSVDPVTVDGMAGNASLDQIDSVQRDLPDAARVGSADQRARCDPARRPVRRSPGRRCGRRRPSRRARASSSTTR